MVIWDFVYDENDDYDDVNDDYEEEEMKGKEKVEWLFVIQYGDNMIG